MMDNDNSNNHPIAKLVSSLDENKRIIEEIFSNNSTIIYKELSIGAQCNIRCMLVYTDGMADYKVINENIIKPILLTNLTFEDHCEVIDLLMKKVLLTGDNKKYQSIEDIVSGIIYGNTMLLIDGCLDTICINTIGWKTRSISEPQAETIVRGPREGFTESISINLSLLRRRIVNPDLKFEFLKLGKVTKTQLCVCYIKGIAKETILEELLKRLNQIEIDGILDSGYIEELIKDAPYSPFRTIINTERPDVIAGKLLEGRFAVICDGSPVVITLPSLFVEVFQSNEDYYDNFTYSSIIRFLRWLCFFLSTSVPAIYVAIVTFHQEIIPTPLLLSIYSSRKGVPFPTIAEALGMIIVFELLKEAGLRMPKYIGQAISIVGALVLGEAAVNAKIVSAPIVIITAITGISSIMLPQVLGILLIRIFFLILSSFLGLFGYTFGVMALVLHLMSLRSFGVPYMLNVPAFSADEVKDTLIRAPLWSMHLRPRLLTKNQKRIKGRRHTNGKN